MNYIRPILFFVFIYLAYGNECFNVEDNVIINEKTLTVSLQRVAPMCNCYNNKLTINKENVKTLVFQNTVASIGNKCFMNFVNLYHVKLL